jgi:hypothetical protein
VDEDERQLHRELIALKAELTAHNNAIRGLLARLGLKGAIDEDYPNSSRSSSAGMEWA